MADCFDLKPGMMVGAALESGASVLDEARKNEILAYSRSGMQTCRLNLRWDLIEPEIGYFCEDCLSYVKEDIMYVSALGIRPLVCLCSSNEPQWFKKRGGWSNKDNTPCFLIYAEKIIKTIGHLASDYLTFSNLNYELICLRQKDISKNHISRSELYYSMSNAAYCHCRCYRLIHDLRREMGFKNSRVSFANFYQNYESGFDIAAVNKVSSFMNDLDISWLMTRAMMLGDFRYPLRRIAVVRKGIYSDFHAVNYKSEYKNLFLSRLLRSKDQNGYEADGLIPVCARLFGMLKVRVYITEVLCTDPRDICRCIFLYDHLKTVCESEIPIRRFYYVAFTDQDSTIEHEVGIASFDPLKTSLRKSGEFLGKVALNGKVNQEIYNEYIGGITTDLMNQSGEMDISDI